MVTLQRELIQIGAWSRKDSFVEESEQKLQRTRFVTEGMVNIPKSVHERSAEFKERNMWNEMSDEARQMSSLENLKKWLKKQRWND